MTLRFNASVVFCLLMLPGCAKAVSVDEHPYGGSSSYGGGGAGVASGGTAGFVSAGGSGTTGGTTAGGASSTGGGSVGGSSSGGTSSGGTGGTSTGGTSTGGTSTGGTSTGGTSTGGTGGTSTGGTSSGGTSNGGSTGGGTCDASSATAVAFQTPVLVPANSCLKMQPASDQTWAKSLILLPGYGAPSISATWTNCTKSGNATLTGNAQATIGPIDPTCAIYVQLGGSSSTNFMIQWWLG